LVINILRIVKRKGLVPGVLATAHKSKFFKLLLHNMMIGHNKGNNQQINWIKLSPELVWKTVHKLIGLSYKVADVCNWIAIPSCGRLSTE